MKQQQDFNAREIMNQLFRSQEDVARLRFELGEKNTSVEILLAQNQKLRKNIDSLEAYLRNARPTLYPAA